MTFEELRKEFSKIYLDLRFGNWEYGRGYYLEGNQPMLFFKTIEEVERYLIEDCILKEGIIKHNNGNCNCDLTDGGYGFCYAEQFISGSISVEDVINDLI